MALTKEEVLKIAKLSKLSFEATYLLIIFKVCLSKKKSSFLNKSIT